MTGEGEGETVPLVLTLPPKGEGEDMNDTEWVRDAGIEREDRGLREVDRERGGVRVGVGI